MCTFKNEHTVIVCPAAIDQVREHLQEVFGETVQYTTIDGQGTLVQASSVVDTTHFQETTRQAIAAAQILSTGQ